MDGGSSSATALKPAASGVGKLRLWLGKPSSAAAVDDPSTFGKPSCLNAACCVAFHHITPTMSPREAELFRGGDLKVKVTQR